MNFWAYVTTPTDGRLGLAAGLVMSLSLFAIAGGILMMILPGLISSSPRWHAVLVRKEVGPREFALRAELLAKVGVGIIVWSSVLIVSLLLRLVGTPGLITRWHPTLVLLVLPLLVGYLIVYRLLFYPRYREVCRRVDSQKSYEPASKKSRKKAKADALGKPEVVLLPTRALIVSVLAFIVYYFITSFVSLPTNLPASNHDHLWHQTGTVLFGFLGYLIGLALSLGDEVRPLVPFLQLRRKESTSSRQ
jgi:hypothetical protein